MQKHSRMIEKKWQVMSLADSHHVDKTIIPIEGSKFKNVRKELIQKGYRKKRTIGQESSYEYSEIKGLQVFIDEGSRTIRAEAPGETAISKVIDDFNLPMYKSM